MSLGRRLYRWFDERLDLGPLLAPLGAKVVPHHRHSFWYIFGGMALTLMAVQAVTGILLMLYYRPTVDAAHASVQRIMTEIPAGSLVRSIHSWGASLLVTVLFVHVFSTLLMAAYRRPRELTWITGCLLLGLVLAFGFSGYLLPWNERSYFATRVASDLAGDVPLVGGLLHGLLRGGEEVGPDTLSRFFAFHVAVLPLATLVALGVHLWLVNRLGVSTPPGVKEPCGQAVPFFPDFALREGAVALGVLAVLVTLAMVRPAEIGVQADMLKPAPEGIAPEWFFLCLFQTLKMFPQTAAGVPQNVIVVCLTLLVGGAFLIVPLLDNGDASGRLRKAIRVVAVALGIYVVATTAYAINQLADVGRPAPVPGASAATQPESGAATDPSDWIGYGLFLAATGVAVVALRLLARQRGQLRAMGLLDRRPGPADAAAGRAGPGRETPS